MHVAPVEIAPALAGSPPSGAGTMRPDERAKHATDSPASRAAAA